MYIYVCIINESLRLNYLLTPWIFGPLTVLSSLIKDAHSSVPTAFCRLLLNFIFCRSFYIPSSHFTLGLPFLLLPSSLLSKYFLNCPSVSILTTCPIRSNLFFLISVTVYRSIYSSLHS